MGSDKCDGEKIEAEGREKLISPVTRKSWGELTKRGNLIRWGEEEKSCG
jgi:hypothetical protein